MADVNGISALVSTKLVAEIESLAKRRQELLDELAQVDANLGYVKLMYDVHCAGGGKEPLKI